MEFINIWEKPEYYPEVVAFWNRLKVLPQNIKAEDRAKELVLMVRKDNQVIGVTTAYSHHIDILNNNKFFIYRILIDPRYRIPGLSSKMTVVTRDFLESLYHNKKSDCIGLIAVTENKHFMKVRNEAVWAASQMVFVGTTKEGKHLRVYYFAGAKI